MSDDEYDDRERHELVMPFVVCSSVGGPYEDDAFVAGFSAGIIDTKLSTREIAATTGLFRTDLTPQIDLIAMRYGYHVDLLAEPEDGWSHLGFTREERSDE